MKFGPVPLGDAEGGVLAHSMQAQAPDAGKRYRIAKGTCLTAQHLTDLAAAGHIDVVIARLEEGDVEENAAAAALAAAIVPDPEGQGVRIAAAGAGRVNLYAMTSGVVRIDRAAIETLNRVDPMITIATVPPYHRVDAKGMIATIKIIAYAVRDSDLARANVAGARAMQVAPPVFASATLIETEVGEGPLPAKGRDALQGRLDRLNMTLTPRCSVGHRPGPLSRAIADAPGEVVFILTASATSDPRDVGPEALRAAGGEVTAFGMPVDPGNLLFFGRLGDKPVIGLPGCARSPALNGADWVLERLLCGIDLRQSDIAAMGVGGLLKEIPTRPRPRQVPE
jgi:molybdenum cofactor cytidylyltransferase